MKQIYAILLLIAGCMLSCKKEKADHQYDNRVVEDTRKNSGVRLVNLAGYNQLVANGDTLTNYVVIPNTSDKPYAYPGTKYFPADGRLSKTWYLPRAFIRADGTAELTTEARVYQGPQPPKLDFSVREVYNGEADYYLLKGKEEAYVIDVPASPMIIPRGVTAPARPDHFKIRVVNMAATLTPQGENVENLTLPLSLAWADGTLVNPVTSNIAPGNYSEYIELPYGTYQFKILTPDGRQVSAGDGNRMENTFILDPATSTLVKAASGRPHTVSTHLTYAPVRTFQPGGIYTIAIAAQTFVIPYYNGGSGEEISMVQNGFQYVSDISEPLNNTYARVQAANVLPGSAAVAFTANGKAMGAPLAFAATGEYGIQIAEHTRFAAHDASGALIAEKEMKVIAGQNYTVWLHRSADGKAALSIAANNLSGISPGTGTDGQDGSYDRNTRKYPFNVRFLNFCEDIPYITFTRDNGQAFNGSGITENIQSGIIPVSGYPYVSFVQGNEAYQFMAYQSSPGIVPGKWLPEIPVIKSDDLIARRELYARGTLPVHEPGIYTIALIGRYGGNPSPEEKAKMIILKHNK